jgi:pimeloyl-ACP methyl ester carboxylesterase
MLKSESTERLTVETADGCKLSVRHAGQGKSALVLIHGFGENNYSWAGIPDRITSTHRVFAVDLRGHGDSGWDPHGEYTLEKFVSDLTAIVDQLAIGPFALAGHSLGADVALQVAVLRPRQVTKLMLVEFSLGGVPADVLEFVLEQFNAQFRTYDSILDYYALLEQQRPLADGEALRRYCENSVRPRPGGGYEVKCDPTLPRLWEVADRTSLPEHRKAISRLACPVLLLRGSGSAILTSAATRQIKELAPQAQFWQVPGAGHAVMLDRPREFNESVCRFLLGEQARQPLHARV